MDACDCSRWADDIGDRCKEIGLALGFETITPEYLRELEARVAIDDDIPW